MEYFLVFLLGIALAVVVLFVTRPGLFTRTKQDFSLFETLFEDAMDELEERQQQLLQEVQERHQALLELQSQLNTALGPTKARSPKVLAVLQLAEEGDDIPVIAKQLGLGVGEVELILELNKDWETLAESE